MLTTSTTDTNNNRKKNLSKESRKKKNQSLQTEYNEHLWEELKKIMDMNHVHNLSKCNTLEKKENYLNNIDYLFKQRVSSHKVPKNFILKSKAYNVLCQFTKYNVYSNKYGSSIKLSISQVRTCASRKTSSKRAFNKNIISLKREFTCVKTALPMKGSTSEWAWVNSKYDKASKSWIKTDKWTLKN